MSLGCWTCRDRKVRCDLKSPKCSNCIQAKRHCLGYGLRLSWPRDTNGRRSKLYIPPPCAQNDAPVEVAWLNVSSNDVRLYYELAYPELAACSYRLPIPVPKPVPLGLIDHQEKSLVDYYNQEGSQFFSSMQRDALAPLILKVALLDTSAASKAVQQALLALSCLHLRRDAMAAIYKTRAISWLSRSLTPATESRVAFQNAAASMLLCTFELSHTSNTSRDWAMYLCGVKRIIDAALMQCDITDGEYAMLIDWVYFHEVLAGFSIVHWGQKTPANSFCYEQPKSKLIHIRPELLAEQQAAYWRTNEIFESISSISRLLLASGSNLTHMERSMLVNRVEERLLSFKPRPLIVRQIGSWDVETKASIILELYRLAALIYLNRAFIGYHGGEEQHRKLVDEATLYLAHVRPHEVPWALFIIGCEARTDEERKNMLQFFPENHVAPFINKLNWMRQMVEASWIYDDLHYDQHLGYFSKLSAVMTHSPIPPAFI